MMNSAETSQESEGPRKIYLDANLQIVFCITLMAILGVASITPALPKVRQALNISPRDIGLLITSFTLPGVVLAPVFGILADRLGRRRILVPSLMLFGIAGSACAFAREFHVLLTFRFIQGIGGAALGSLNVTLIGDLYSGKQRTKAMGYNASVMSIGTAGFPAIAGALAMVDWYYPFLLAATAIVVGLIVLLSLRNPEPDKGQHFRDYLGNAWRSMQNRQIVGVFAASIVTFIALYGSYLTFFPLLVAQKFRMSSFTIGMLFSGMSVATALASSQLGRLGRRYEEVTLLRVSLSFYAVSLVMIPWVSSLWALLIPVLISGITLGIIIPCTQTLLAGLTPTEYRGAYMSLNGMVLRIGQTLGPVLMGAAMGLWGIDGAFYAGAAFIAGLLLLLFVLFK